ncbi:diguanylate cyclase (GGDEF) domain protein [Roseibium alexandrii DFL-11]|uniref:Diguanylate cyclase (GGDEF) domain protein n=2 Tax=Roseibium alexandrii TaxID=388408 RepID=A0A5E8GXD6_ROSAD|nr:diguanylate cyclase (GGDEF) domain protein [Roseibium alexandrii DFL-11]
MATSFVRSNIVIFLISMSLVMLLAAGVYASNRLLTHWLLVKGLEQTYAAWADTVYDTLQPREVRDTAVLPQTLDGLRMTLTSDGRSNAYHEQVDTLQNSLQSGHAPAGVLHFSILPSAMETREGPQSAAWASPEWEEKNLFLAPQTLTDAKVAALSSPRILAIPDMNTVGKFGNKAVIVYPAKDANSRSLIALVSTATIMKSLVPLLFSVSAAIGGLCLISFLFAGILLWMRFREQLQTSKNIQYLAHHDTLTGLPNRAVFNARLSEALRFAQAKASNIGVMIIDVDKFKEINDTHGHGIGDVFLQIIADRLKSVFSGHLVARLSGDEFAVMLTSVSDTGRMARLAADMISATDPPCNIDGREIKISLSIGLARATDGSWRSSRLLHCADLALYRAKHEGRSTFCWYTQDLDAEAQKRKEIEQGLVKALKFDQLKLKYQPQYALSDGSLKGYEALIRWEHPTKGMMRPDSFIPIAEDTGLIEDIGNWVLEQACREAALWPNSNRRVAINMSPAQFAAGDIQKRVARALQSSGLDPKRLEIEITESLLISNTDSVVHTLRQIRDMGVSIAMDDFGTGYSSLSYLSLFPFDKIKIDKAFIQDLGKEASTDAIVTSIVGLGRSLNVTITAEGVETEEQAILLRAAGCDLIQGYLYGKPDDVKVHETVQADMTAKIRSVKKTWATQSAKPGSDPATNSSGPQKAFVKSAKSDMESSNSLPTDASFGTPVAVQGS